MMLKDMPGYKDLLELHAGLDKMIWKGYGCLQGCKESL